MRIYNIKLSCGCLYSSYGDYCIPCFSDDCKCQEEYYNKDSQTKTKSEVKQV